MTVQFDVYSYSSIGTQSVLVSVAKGLNRKERADVLRLQDAKRRQRKESATFKLVTYRDGKFHSVC